MLPLPDPLVPSEAVLRDEPTEQVVHIGLQEQARRLTEVVECHIDEVVSLLDVVTGNVGGLDRIPMVVYENPTPLAWLSDRLSHASCWTERGEAETGAYIL